MRLGSQGEKLKRSCHSPHLAKIQEMKGISESPLPMVIYTICQKLSVEEYRKYSAHQQKLVKIPKNPVYPCHVIKRQGPRNTRSPKALETVYVFSKNLASGTL